MLSHSRVRKKIHSVGRLVGWSVGRSVCHNCIKGRKITLVTYCSLTKYTPVMIYDIGICLYIFIYYTWEKLKNDGNQKLQLLFRRVFPLTLGWFSPFYVVFWHFGSFLAILSSFLPLWGGQTPVTPVAWSVDHFESILAASKNCVMGFNDLKYLVEYLW